MEGGKTKLRQVSINGASLMRDRREKSLTSREIRSASSRRADSNESGDTLLEILLAMVVLGIASVAMLLAFGTTISASGEYKGIAQVDTVLRQIAEQATTQVQQEPTSYWSTCPNSPTLSFTVPSGYSTPTTVVSYWNSSTSTFGTTCVPNSAQMLTMTVTYQGTSYSISTVVYDSQSKPVPSFGAATQLAFLAPMTSSISGTPLSTAPVVAVEDANGNIVTSAAPSLTLTVTPGTGASGASLAGCTGSNFYGVITFSNCSISAVGTGYTLSVSDSNPNPLARLTGATSSQFNVTPGSASTLVFTSVPAGGQTVNSTAAIGTFQVQQVDRFGNPVLASAPVTVNLSTTSTGTAGNSPFFSPFQGGTSSSAVTSVVIPAGSSSTGTFYYSDTAAGSPAVSATSGLLTAATSYLSLAPARPGKLVVTSQPAATMSSGSTTGLTVQVQDPYGNVETTGYTGSTDTISLALNSGSFNGGTTSKAAVGGVATFSGLQINTAGTYTITASDLTTPAATPAISSSFIVSAGGASKLGITAQPSSVTAGGTTGLTVQVQDQYGNLVSSGTGSTDTISLALNSGSFNGGTTSKAAVGGVATFSGLQINTAGTYTIRASDTTHTGYTAVTSSSFTVSASTPNKLVVSAQPGSITAGGTTGLTVQVQDQYGNLVSSGTGSTDTISLALNSGSFNAGTTSKAAVGGIATFSGLQVNTAGTYTITASDTTRVVPSATSNSFTVSAAAASQLTITAQPGSITAGGTTGLTVQVQDQYGNLVSSGTGSTDTISLALNSGSFNGGTTSKAAVGGVATFSGLQINTAGTYTITASDTTHTGYAAETSNSFTVSAAAASQLTITAQPGSITAGGTTGLTVQVQDQYGNLVSSGTGSTDTISLALNSGSFNGGTTSKAAVGGVATFSGLQINTAGTYTITASDTTHTGYTAATSSSFKVFGPPSKLVVTAQPGSITAGGTTGLTVSVEDATGNVITSGAGSTDTISLALNSGSFNAGTTSKAAVGGVATFTGLQINTAGTYTITASDLTTPAATSATSNSFTVGAGTVSKLAITAQPGSITAGGTTGLTVQVQDQYGNLVSSGTGSTDTISLALNSGSFNAGTTSKAAVGGIATFSGLQINTAGTYTITASDTTRVITTATSSSFTVSAGGASKLVVSAQPGSITAGSTTGLTVQVQDQYGNLVSSGTGSTDTISLALNSGSFNAGTTSKAAVGGIATFSGLQINTAGTYTITASDLTTPAATPATTNSFTVNPAAPNKLVVSAQPGSITAGGTTGLTVQVQDQYGNLVSSGTGSTDTISLALNSGSFNGGTTSKAAVGGVATFSGLQINTAGTYTITASDLTTPAATPASTNSFTVNPAAPNKLVVSAQPGSITAGGTTGLTVQVQDQYGNLVSSGTGSTDSISLALNSGTFNGGTTSKAAVGGVATFSGLQINTAGTYTITASDTTRVITTATSSSFTVSAGGASKLGITAQPSSIAAGGTTGLTVQVQDQYGNLVSSGTGSTDTISLALNSGSFNGGTPSKAAVGGVATFSGLQINTAGTYTITASDTTHTGYTAATSSSFTVSAASPNKLVVSAQPGSITVGGTTGLTVQVQDQYGNLVSSGTGSTDTISLALNSGSFNAGTTSSPAVGGVATFSGLQINTAGTFTITASDTTRVITTATSSSFTVSAGGASKLGITAQPTSITAGGTTGLTVQVQDQYGNLVSSGTGSTDTISLALNSGSFNAGTTSKAAVGGIATFTGLQINTAGTYTITASDTTHTGYTAATSSSFTVSAAAASQLTITAQPTSITAGGTTGLTVQVQDQYGNLVSSGTGSTDTISLALNSGTFNGGTTSKAAVGGIATFSGLQINTAGTYTITASDTTHTGYAAETSNSFTVNPAAPNKLAVSAQPTSITAGGTTGLTVQVQDQYGNLETTGNTGSTDTISLALNSGTFNAGTTSKAAVGGIATFSGLQINTAGTYTITASDLTTPAATSTTSNSFTVSATAASQLTITAQPARSRRAGPRGSPSRSKTSTATWSLPAQAQPTPSRWPSTQGPSTGARPRRQRSVASPPSQASRSTRRGPTRSRRVTRPTPATPLRPRTASRSILRPPTSWPSRLSPPRSRRAAPPGSPSRSRTSTATWRPRGTPAQPTPSRWPSTQGPSTPGPPLRQRSVASPPSQASRSTRRGPTRSRPAISRHLQPPRRPRTASSSAPVGPASWASPPSRARSRRAGPRGLPSRSKTSTATWSLPAPAQPTPSRWPSTQGSSTPGPPLRQRSVAWPPSPASRSTRRGPTRSRRVTRPTPATPLRHRRRSRSLGLPPTWPSPSNPPRSPQGGRQGSRSLSRTPTATRSPPAPARPTPSRWR